MNVSKIVWDTAETVCYNSESSYCSDGILDAMKFHLQLGNFLKQLWLSI